MAKVPLPTLPIYWRDKNNITTIEKKFLQLILLLFSNECHLTSLGLAISLIIVNFIDIVVGMIKW